MSLEFKGNTTAQTLDATALAAWDFYDDYYFIVNVHITPKRGADAAGQKVVLTAPEGMRFIKPAGEFFGITDLTISRYESYNDFRVATFTLDNNAVSEENSTALISGNVLLTAAYRNSGGNMYDSATSYTRLESIAAWKGNYALYNGRPKYEVTAGLQQGATPLGTTAEYTITPKGRTSPGSTAFGEGSLGFWRRGLNNVSPRTGHDLGTWFSTIAVDRDGVLTSGDSTSFIAEMSKFQLALYQNKDTATEQYEPVWGISYQLHLPEMLTVGEGLQTYFVAGDTLDTNYFKMGGEGGYPVQFWREETNMATQAVYEYPSAADAEIRTVLYTKENSNIGLRLKPGESRTKYNNRDFSAKLVVSYSTLDESGNVVQKTQTVDNALRFHFNDVAHVDWLKLGTPAINNTTGFVLDTTPVHDPYRYVSLATGGTKNNTNETHEGGTLTFENKGGYYVDALHYYESNSVGTNYSHYNNLGKVTAKYYTADAPDVAKTLAATASNLTYVRDVSADNPDMAFVFPTDQTKENYVTKIELTLEDGHADPLSTEIYFEMHGFEGLAANKTDDTTYHHSSMVTTLRDGPGSEGCAGSGYETTGASPKVVDGSHSITTPVKVRLVEEDLLNVNVSGKGKPYTSQMVEPRDLSGYYDDDTLPDPSSQIYVQMGYATLDPLTGKYIYDPAARKMYENFCLELGVEDPNGYNKNGYSPQDSRRMLQRIDGKIYIDGSMHYTNGRFVYTTNKNSEPQTLTVGNNGDPGSNNAVGGVTKTVVLNLRENGDYLTSLKFMADTFRVVLQNYGGIGSAKATSDDYYSGKTALEKTPYWQPYSRDYYSPEDRYGRRGVNHFTFSTTYEHAFPDGTEINPNIYYNVYAKASANNMEGSFRHSQVSPWGGVGNARASSFLVSKTVAPWTPTLLYKDVNSLNSYETIDSLNQGNTFYAEITYPNPTDVLGGVRKDHALKDGKIWLELTPGFVYVGNPDGLTVTRVQEGDKSHLCVDEGDVIRTAAKTWRLELLALPTGQNRQPVAKLWYDYTATVAQSAALLQEAPYVAIDGADRYYDATAPALNGAEQRLSAATSLPTLNVNLSSVGAVTLRPGAGGAYSKTSTAGVKYAQKDDLNLLVQLGIHNNMAEPFSTEIPIPTAKGAGADYPLRLTGPALVQYGSVAGTDIAVTYHDGDDWRTGGEIEAGKGWGAVTVVNIVVNKIDNDVVVLDLPLKADLAKSDWVNGNKSNVSGRFSYEQGGAPLTGNNNTVSWQLEGVYTVEYQPGSVAAATNLPNPQKYWVVEGEEHTIPDTTPTDPAGAYEFTGWKIDGDATGYQAGYTFEPMVNTVFIAQWKAIEKDDSSSTPVSSEPASSSAVVSSALPASSSPSSSSAVVSSSTPASSSSPGSEAPAVKYWLRFNANGGTGAPAGQNLAAGQKTTRPGTIPTRSGYTFGDWNTRANGKGSNWNFAKNTMPAHDVTLYATWTPESGPASSSAEVPLPPAAPSEGPAASSRLPASSTPDTRGGASGSGSSSSAPPAASAPAQSSPPAAPAAADPATPAGTPAETAGIPAEPITGLTENDHGRMADQTGNPLTDLISGNVPLGHFGVGGAWSLLSLLMSLLGLLVALLLFISMLVRHKQRAQEEEAPESADAEEDEGRAKARRATLLRLGAIVTGLLTGFVFLILDNLSHPMVWINRNTVIVALVFVVHMVLVAVFNLLRRREAHEEDDKVEVAR
uniref:Uncharacterized protein n=1 Tax=termite gut metagenome TaxID=433724 RepID=S0DEV6_9ZZZZ